MRILARTSGQGADRRVALFGGGLLGSAIAGALGRAGFVVIAEQPCDWTDAGRREVQLAAMEQRLTAGAPDRIDLIWAAGVSGFGSDIAQMDGETAIVAQLVAAARRLGLGAGSTRHAFHLISSGGGLYEGIARTDLHTPPQPLRPYGEGKLAQERLVHALANDIAVTRIYRPSSVYGFVPGGRRGLFATLIFNALAARVTTITGAATTLRDYVLSDDIGTFIARQVAEAAEGHVTCLLGSGKPTAMYEVLATIEDLVQRPVLRRFDPTPSNSLNFAFARSALPPGWQTTPLAVGLERTYSRMKSAVVRAGRS